MCEINENYESIYNYYNLSDILLMAGSKYVPTDAWIKTLNEVCNSYYGISNSITTATAFYKALGLKLNQGFLFATPETYETINEAICLKLSRILNKNENIIGAYLEEYTLLNNALDGVTSKSTSRFNDTPDEEGSYSTEEYTSTITSNENFVEYDVPTKISILTHKIDSLIERYCKEFEEFILCIN